MINSSDLEAFDYYEPTQMTLPLEHKQTPLDMVKEFSTILKQTPSRELSLALVLEEYKEWMDEVQGNIGSVAELKELTDLVYVIYGYANAVGWDLDEALYRVHCNNLARCVQVDGSVKYREDGKVLKRKDAPKVKLEDLV